MFNDVERCSIYNIQNVCHTNYLFVISFQLMFYKTLRYRLVRPLTVTRLRYNFILVSKLISEKAYYVKVYAHQAIVYTGNLLKSTMLRPLKGEVGYKLAASKWSKTPARAPLDFNCQIDLMFFLKLIVFCISPWLTMLLHVDVHRSYTPSTAFTISFPKLLVHVFNRES